MASKAVRLGPHLKELRIHLCQTSASSQGVRNFVHENYVSLKCANPEFPILIRECSGITPRLWARYEFGKEKSFELENSSSGDQMANVNSARTIRFIPQIMDMHIYFCVRAHNSQGLMEFIDKYLPDVRKGNPHVPFRLVHSPEVDPWIWARYQHMQHRKLEVRNMNANQVLAAVEYLAAGCWKGIFQVHDNNPAKGHFGMRLRDTETRFRDPYTVFSKR